MAQPGGGSISVGPRQQPEARARGKTQRSRQPSHPYSDLIAQLKPAIAAKNAKWDAAKKEPAVKVAA
jgi:hypothetical protein